MRFQAALFDLDGTLLDTLRDLADSMNAALDAHGHPTHALDAFRHFVGDGVHVFAERALPQDRRSPEEIQATVDLALAEYAQRWQRHTVPYEGVDTMLDGLVRRGLRIAILSNKPDAFTKLTVAALLGAWSFDLVWGVSDDVPKKPDPRGALRAAETLGVAPEQILYCGDTDTDMQTAVAAGMHPAGALWGFREAEELTNAGARVLVTRPTDLLGLL